MWRYPTLIASTMASSSSGSSCQVPKPIAGISAPVLSLNLEAAMLLTLFSRLCVSETCVAIQTGYQLEWSNISHKYEHQWVERQADALGDASLILMTPR